VIADKDIYVGQVVFDKRRTDVTDGTMVIVEVHGELSDQPSEISEPVKSNDFNRKASPGPDRTVPEDATIVSTRYLDEDGTADTTSYAYPTYRLEPAEMPNGTVTPERTLAEVLREMEELVQSSDVVVDDVDSFRVLALEAGVPGSVLAAMHDE
jgi:hypothetical protein